VRRSEDFGRGGVGSAHSIQFVNNCGFGTPFLRQSDGQALSGSSANKSGPLVEGIAFLEQGFCGSASNLRCTALEIRLAGPAENCSYVRILQTAFSVPVSFVFSQGCSSFGQCLNQACRPRILECSARDASAVVTFCPEPPSLFHLPPTTPSISSTTSPISTAHASPSPFDVPPTPRRFLHRRESQTSKLLGAELGGTIGGAALLLLLFIAFVFIRRRRARQIEARMPQRQEPFIVNPTWVLPSPTTPEGAHTGSHLSLPDRARPRTVPFAHQMSLPNLSTTQYRTRVLRPRASTVGSGSVLARTETRGSREESDTVDVGVGPTRSESSVWRPRIDILAARQQRTEGSGPAPPQTPMDSFWAE